MNNETKQN